MSSSQIPSSCSPQQQQQQQQQYFLSLLHQGIKNPSENDVTTNLAWPDLTVQGNSTWMLMKIFLLQQFSGCFSQYLLGVACESITDLQHLHGGCTLGSCYVLIDWRKSVVLLSKETQENKRLL